jgi:cytochrome c oxidase subunit 2
LISGSFLAGCSGAQSALDPAGRESARIAHLFWFLAAGAAVIWLALLGLTFCAVRARPESFNRRRADLIIVGGGAVAPTIILTIMLVFGLAMVPSLVAPAPQGSMTVAVSGEMWWWRVRYEPDTDNPIVLANEIHLPVGEPVQFRLESANVIHSFWVPSLAGKMDMIPGRVTRLALTPTRTGVFHGVCAEFCGTSHALMKFVVVVEERDDFDRWLEQQAEPAESPSGALAVRGQESFVANGCGACHTVRGTQATGVIGPDLTHVGSRSSIAAGTLRGRPEDFRRWVALTDDVKPGAHMPRFGMLPEDEQQALAAYLAGLK